MFPNINAPSGHKSDRDRLVDEISSLSERAVAESSFAEIFPKKQNPWLGAREQLAAATQQLEALDDQAKLLAFERLITRYQGACNDLHLAIANNTSRIAELEKEITACGGYEARYRGAHLRTGPPTSKRDEEERAAAAVWLRLEQERVMLAAAIGNPREVRTSLEKEHPFLVALGVQINADNATAKAFAD
jgi:hypothetical protein